MGANQVNCQGPLGIEIDQAQVCWASASDRDLLDARNADLNKDFRQRIAEGVMTPHRLIILAADEMVPEGVAHIPASRALR